MELIKLAQFINKKYNNITQEQINIVQHTKRLTVAQTIRSVCTNVDPTLIADQRNFKAFIYTSYYYFLVIFFHVHIIVSGIFLLGYSLHMLLFA